MHNHRPDVEPLRERIIHQPYTPPLNEIKETKYVTQHRTPTKKSIGRGNTEIPSVLRRQSNSPIKKASVEKRSRLPQTSSPIKGSSSLLSDVIELQIVNLKDGKTDENGL